MNISDVADFAGVHRPISVRGLQAGLNALPESVPFHSTIVTGTALGGEVNLILNSDGSYSFGGFMRATGFPSFSFRVVAVVRSASGAVSLVCQHSGEVFGTDTPGDRQDNWNEVGSDPALMKQIRNLWPDISGGSMVVSRSSELSGVLGTAVDVVKDIAEFVLAAYTLGTTVAVCLVIGAELQNAGVSLPGLGGVVGVGVVAGVVYIWGPSSIVAAIVAGIAVGEVVDALVIIRPLRDDEIDFARGVFGNSLDYSRIRVTNLSGLSTRAFTAPAVDGSILLNIGNAVDQPIRAVYPNYPVAGQIFIHELTHAWQLQHASLQDGYVPGLICEGLYNQAVLGKSAYQVGPAGPDWSSFNLEAQAAIVDTWFAGTQSLGVAGRLTGMSPNSPYYGYIENNILPGVP